MADELVWNGASVEFIGPELLTVLASELSKKTNR